MIRLNPLFSQPLPLWAVTLLGVLVGLVTSKLMLTGGRTPELQVVFAVVAFTWVAALGLVFFDSFRSRLGALVLAVLVAVASLSLWPYLNQPETILVLLALALGGAFLLPAVSNGGSWLQWNWAGIPAFVVSAMLVFIVAGLLGGLFYGLMQLAAALFAGVGFGGLRTWLNKAWVSAPLLLGAAAFFVGALRAQQWGQNLTRTLAHLLGYLLPVASLITAVFALLLPVAALQNPQKLFQGLLSSSMYLSLTGITFLLIVLAYHARPAALPAALQQFTRLSAYLLPIYPLLALYGLSVRAQQYGLTDSRVLGLAVAVWLLVTGVALVFTRREPVFEKLESVVALSSAVMFLLGVFLSLPGLRPAEIGTRSQVARIENPATPQKQRADSLLYLKTEPGIRSEGIHLTTPQNEA